MLGPAIADGGALQQLGQPAGVVDLDQQRLARTRVHACRRGGFDVVTGEPAGGEHVAMRGRARRRGVGVDVKALNVRAEPCAWLPDRTTGQRLGHRGLVRLQPVLVDDHAHPVGDIGAIPQPVGVEAELDIRAGAVLPERLADLGDRHPGARLPRLRVIERVELRVRGDRRAQLAIVANQIKRLPRRQPAVTEDLEHALRLDVVWQREGLGSGRKLAEPCRPSGPAEPMPDRSSRYACTGPREKASPIHRASACARPLPLDRGPSCRALAHHGEAIR